MFENTIESALAADNRSWGFKKKAAKQDTKQDDPPDVRTKFYIKQEMGGAKAYYKDFHQKELAITATDAKIKTRLHDQSTVSGMLSLAKSRGWQSIKVSGTQEFKREAWVQAQMKGVEVTGYKPSEIDKQELAKRMAEQAQMPTKRATQSQPKPQQNAAPTPVQKPVSPSVFNRVEAAGQNVSQAKPAQTHTATQSTGMAA